MKSRRIAITLLAPGLILAGAQANSAQAAEDICSQLIIYAINQVCRLLPNGQNLCQPVALTGPSQSCNVPPGTPLTPVPLAPPSLQPPMAYPYVPMARPPYPGIPPYAPFPPVPAYAPPQFALPQPAAPQFIPSPLPGPLFAMPQPATPPVRPPEPAPAIAAPPAVATPPAPAGMPAPQVDAAPALPEPQAVTAVTPAPEQPSPPPGATEATPPVTPPAEPAPIAQTPPAPQASPAATAAPAAGGEVPQSPPAVVVEDALAHFPFDSAELTAAGKEALGTWLASAPVGMPVLIRGHADRLGPEPYNLKLSQRRAEAARDYLVGLGKDPRDIRVLARGEADPVKRCKGGPTPTTKDCLAPNRRVEITHE